MIKDDGSVMNFKNPKVQASLPSNTFAVTGHLETKQITDMLPGILNQLGAESLSHLRELAGGPGLLGASNEPTVSEDEDDVPELVENFDEVCKDKVPNIPVSTTQISETTEVAAEVPNIPVSTTQISETTEVAAEVPNIPVTTPQISDETDELDISEASFHSIVD